MAGTAEVAPSHADHHRYEIHESSLGPVLIATSRRGVCAILFGDDQDALETEFERRFPQARIASPDPFSRALMTSALAMIEAQPVKPPPIDLRGTDFQKRIWQTLLDVPAGSIISYKELARRAGAPLAVRAVAGACAANPLALIVPCHRIVREDGGLSGYRWGVARKQALLEREGVLIGGAKRIGACRAPGLR